MKRSHALITNKDINSSIYNLILGNLVVLCTCKWLVLFTFLFANILLTAQVSDSIVPPQIIEQNLPIVETDSIAISTNEKKKKNALLESEVKYSASDSTLFNLGKVFLYGNASVGYQDILLTAHYIELDMDSSIAFARGTRDSLGVEMGQIGRAHV